MVSKSPVIKVVEYIRSTSWDSLLLSCFMSVWVSALLFVLISTQLNYCPADVICLN